MILKKSWRQGEPGPPGPPPLDPLVSLMDLPRQKHVASTIIEPSYEFTQNVESLKVRVVIVGSGPPPLMGILESRQKEKEMHVLCSFLFFFLGGRVVLCFFYVYLFFVFLFLWVFFFFCFLFVFDWFWQPLINPRHSDVVRSLNPAAKTKRWILGSLLYRSRSTNSKTCRYCDHSTQLRIHTERWIRRTWIYISSLII